MNLGFLDSMALAAMLIRGCCPEPELFSVETERFWEFSKIAGFPPTVLGSL